MLLPELFSLEDHVAHILIEKFDGEVQKTKEFEIGNRKILCDFYLPNFKIAENNHLENVVFKVKGKILFDTLDRCYEEFCLLKEKGVKHYIIITENREGAFYTPLQKNKKRFKDLHFESWTLSHLNGLLNGRKFPDRQSNAFGFSDFDYNSIENFEKLRAIASKTKISFFLGAGVSCSANLPDWNNLLNNIKRHVDSKSPTLRNIAPNVIELYCNHSGLIEGRYLSTANNIKNRTPQREYKEFISCVKKSLYPQKTTYYKSRLLDSLCGAISSSKLHIESAITYNFDDLLEESLKNKKIPVCSIYNHNSPVDFSFPVYHVHGILGNPSGNSKLESDIIFREQEYHDLYMNAYNWSNVEQLHALSRNVCIFVGLSMTDPNLRRLLEISYKESEHVPHHFAFLKKSVSRTNDMINAKMLRDLGVIVIWYDNHNDLPPLIDQLH